MQKPLVMGIVVALRKQWRAVVRYGPLCQKHPLTEVKHYVAGVPMGQSITHDTTSLEGFYSARGVALFGTVVDGDCDFDTMCIMLGVPQTLEQRNKIREELYEYHSARARAMFARPLGGLLRHLGGR